MHSTCQCTSKFCNSTPNCSSHILPLCIWYTHFPAPTILEDGYATTSQKTHIFTLNNFSFYNYRFHTHIKTSIDSHIYILWPMKDKSWLLIISSGCDACMWQLVINVSEEKYCLYLRSTQFLCVQDTWHWSPWNRMVTGYQMKSCPNILIWQISGNGDC
jgi:hypothetical protein